ncbi:MAG: hypothetical protein KBT04_02950, partial [Bacteroidales bacterium]|nr:hypothetical protein [Candidatus Colimorpha onthohippi]
MKRLLLVLPFLVTFFATMALWAQVPQGISYQAVVRNANNRIAVNQSVKVKLSVLQGSETGSPVYCEIHLVQTNINGLFNVEIGKGMQGNCGSFNAIKWGEGPFYLKSEVDLNNDNDFSDFVATQKMLSVPYALYAEKAGHLVGFTDTISLDAHILAIRDRAQANSETLRQDLLSLRNNTRTADSLANDRIDSLLAWTYGYDSLLNARFISFMDSSIVINKKMDDSLFFRVDSLLNGHNVDFSSVNGRVDSLAAVVTNRYVGHRDSIVFLYDTIVNHMANREYAKKVDDSLFARIDSVIVVMKANYDTLDSIAYYWDTFNYNRLMAKMAGDSAFLNDSIDQVAQNLGSAVSSINSNFNNYYTKNKVNDTISYVLDSIRNVAGTLNDTAKYLNDSIDQVAQNLGSAVSSINSNFDNYYTKNKVNDTVGYVLDSIRAVAGTLNDTAKYLNDSIDQVAQNLRSAVSSINSNFNNYYTKNEIKDTVGYVLDSIRNVAGTLNDTAKYLNDSIDNVAQNLSNAVSTIQSNFDNYYTKNEIKDTVGYVLDSIRNVAGTVNDTAKYLNDSIDQVAQNLSSAVSTIQSNFDNYYTKNEIKDTVGYVLDSIRAVAGTVNDTARYLNDSIDQVAQDLSNAVSTIQSNFDNYYTKNEIKDTVGYVLDSIRAVAGTLNDTAKYLNDSIDNVAQNLSSAVSTIQSNFDNYYTKNEIKDTLGYIYDSIRNVAGTLNDTAKHLNDSIDNVAAALNDTANAHRSRLNALEVAVNTHSEDIPNLQVSVETLNSDMNALKETVNDTVKFIMDSLRKVNKTLWDTAGYFFDSIHDIATTLNDTARYFNTRVDSTSNAIQQHTALADARYVSTRDSLTSIYDTFAYKMAHRAITKKMDDSLFSRIDSV